VLPADLAVAGQQRERERVLGGEGHVHLRVDLGVSRVNEEESLLGVGGVNDEESLLGVDGVNEAESLLVVDGDGDGPELAELHAQVDLEERRGLDPATAVACGHTGVLGRLEP
jgi:hypothetical protein